MEAWIARTAMRQPVLEECPEEKSQYLQIVVSGDRLILDRDCSVRRSTHTLQLGLMACFVSLALTFPVDAQSKRSPFACSCTQNESGAFCKACRAASRDDCTCEDASPPPACPKDLDAVKAQLQQLQTSNSNIEGKIKRISQVVEDFDTGKKDCKTTRPEMKNFTDSDTKQLKTILATLQTLSRCALLLRKDIEEEKRIHPTNLPVAKRLREVNNLIIDIDRSKDSPTDTNTKIES